MTPSSAYNFNRELRTQLYEPNSVDLNSDGGIILRAYPRPSNEQFAKTLFDPSKVTDIANDRIPFSSPNPSPPSSQGPSGVSFSPLAGIYAVVVAGRAFTAYCRDNQRRNTELGVNSKDLGLLEKIGIRKVRICQEIIKNQPCTVAHMPHLKNSRVQIIAGPSDLIGKTAKNLNELRKLNGMGKESKNSKESETPSKSPATKDLSMNKGPTPETAPASSLMAESQKPPAQQVENPSPPANLAEPKISDILSVSLPDAGFVQEETDLMKAVNENKKVQNDPNATAEEKKNSEENRSNQFNKFLAKTRGDKPFFYDGQKKSLFEQYQKWIDLVEAKRDQHRKLINEGQHYQKLANDHTSKATEEGIRGDSSKQAEHTAKALEYQTLGTDKCSQGLNGAIFYGMQTGVLKELKFQAIIFPSTLQLVATSSSVNAALDLAEEYLIEGKVDVKKAATSVAVNTVVGTLFQIGSSVAHSAVVAGLSEYSQGVGEKIPGISTCGKAVRASYTFYTAKTYTEGVSGALLVVCEDSVELAIVSGATGALAMTPLAPFSPVLGPAIGKGAWRAAKIGVRYFFPGSAQPSSL